MSKKDIVVTWQHIWNIIVFEWLLLLTLVLATSCGDAGAGRYDIVIHDDTRSVSVESVDAGVDAVLEVIGGKGHQLSGLELRVEAQPLPLDGWSNGPCKYPAYIDGASSGLCAAGLSYTPEENLIRVWKDTPCWARTAWVHELCHTFQWYRDGATDAEHHDPKWWMGASPRGSTTSVEGRAMTIAIAAECPDSP